MAWSDVEIDRVVYHWDNERSVTALWNKLKEEDKFAFVEELPEENAIRVVFKGYETIIHTENKVVEDDGSTVYKYSGEMEFTGNNYLDTGICLFSEENIHKNFEISFNIVSLGSNPAKDDTLVNSMNEAGDPWPGLNVKWTGKNKNLVVKVQTNTNTNDDADAIVSDTVTNVKIIRIDDKVYYSFDGKECVKLNDYTGFNKFFDIPLTFGGLINPANNQPYRFFKGTLSDMSLKFIDDDISIDEYNPHRKPLKTVYKHEEQYVFDGESDYINTGLYMFTNKNIDKDFEISFNIDSVEDEYDFQAALINAKYEKQDAGYPGFVCRFNDSSKNLKFTAKGGAGNDVTYNYSQIIGKKVKIYRKDRVMYMSINDGEPKKVYDFTSFNNYHSVPITIGCSLQGDTGEPWRFFHGTLSNIEIKVEED